MKNKSKEKKMFIKLIPLINNGELNDININDILKKNLIEEEDFYYFFPKKTESLCTFYFKNIQYKLENRTSKKFKNEKSISKRVNYILSELIELFENDKITCLYFLNYMFSKPFFLKKNSLKFSHRIWYLLKDKSVDFNFYTKRLILSQILINSTLHWRGNEGTQSTKAFISKQIYLLGRYGYYKAQTKKFTCNFFPKNILSKLDFLHKN